MDEVVWQCINQNFCSYKVKLETTNFCRNEFNVTGFCNKQSCPLANSRYATVREKEGILYLYVKTVERAHTPAKMWERVQLSKNYSTALQQINDELIYWPSFLVHKCKQRLTKLTQYLMKMRRLKMKGAKKTLIPINKKVERREVRREQKAQIAARLDKSIEKELLDRLRTKAYGDAPLNVNEDVWKEILEGEKEGIDAESDETDEDADEDDEEEMEDEDEDENFGEHEFVEDDDESEDELEDMYEYGEGGDFEDEEGSNADEEGSDEEDDGSSADDESPKSEAKKRKLAKQDKSRRQPERKKKRGDYVEVEYEHETEPAQKVASAATW